MVTPSGVSEALTDVAHDVIVMSERSLERHQAEGASHEQPDLDRYRLRRHPGAGPHRHRVGGPDRVRARAAFQPPDRHARPPRAGPRAVRMVSRTGHRDRPPALARTAHGT